MKFNRKALVLVFVAFIVVWGIVGYYLASQAHGIESARKENCSIEYGKVECVNGMLVIPFFNPNTRPINKVMVNIPAENGVDHYVANQPLGALKAKTLTTAKCLAKPPGQLEVEWCCEKCYKTKMDNPSESVTISRG